MGRIRGHRTGAAEGPVRVIGYTRVSTLEQGLSGLGLEAQRQALHQECDRRGWALLSVVEDVASGKSMAHRPGLTGVLEALRAEEATVLMSAKLDRLSRSVQDFAELLERAQRERWGLVALDAPADTTSPQGEALAQMLVVFSQLERRLIGQRTKEALAGLRAQGVRLGRPQVLPRQVVKRIVLERASGRTLQAIADGLNGDGVPTAHGGSAWWPSTVGNVLAGNVKAGA